MHNKIDGVLEKTLCYFVIFIFVFLLTSCGNDGGGGDNNTSPVKNYKTACHEVIATCNSNSSCNAFAKN